MAHATPNLPSRDFLRTKRFYGKLGFAASYRSGHWLILRREEMQLEVFPWPGLEPLENNHSRYILLDDLNALVSRCRVTEIPEVREGIPRIVPPQRDISGLTIAYLVDPDGSLLRLVQNQKEA